MTRDLFHVFIQKSNWIEAKTAAQSNPHEYCLRREMPNWEFESAVIFIRQNAETEYFFGKPYQVFKTQGRKYWTMGAPLEETILINRTVDFEIYDKIAGQYDALGGSAWTTEDQELKKILEPKLQYPILDVGCGTGTFARIFGTPSDQFMGIDPSSEMLKIHRANFPLHRVQKTSFEVFQLPKREPFNPKMVIALYGTPSYILPKYVTKFHNFGGKYFLMFYKPDYNVFTHQATGIKPLWWKYTPKLLETLFGVEPYEFGNYLIVTNV